MPVNEAQQALPLQAIPCLENIIPSQGVSSRSAKAKGLIADSGFTGFLRYFTNWRVPWLVGWLEKYILWMKNAALCCRHVENFGPSYW